MGSLRTKAFQLYVVHGWAYPEEFMPERAPLDNISGRRVKMCTWADLFREATSENMSVLIQAIERSGTPVTIFSGNRSCFVDMHKRDPKKSWKPAAFKEDLLSTCIDLINSGSCHPRINGNLERSHRNIKEKICHYESLLKYIEYYKRRLFFTGHWQLKSCSMYFQLRRWHEWLEKRTQNVEADMNN